MRSALRSSITTTTRKLMETLLGQKGQITYRRVRSRRTRGRTCPAAATCSSLAAYLVEVAAASNQTFPRCLISSWWMLCSKTCCNLTIIRVRKTALFRKKGHCSSVTRLSKNNFKLKFLRWLKKFKRNVNKFLLKFVASNLFYKQSDSRVSTVHPIWILLPRLIQLRNLIPNQKLKNRR